jgi:hypothetical protein
MFSMRLPRELEAEAKLAQKKQKELETKAKKPHKKLSV